MPVVGVLAPSVSQICYSLSIWTSGSQEKESRGYEITRCHHLLPRTRRHCCCRVVYGPDDPFSTSRGEQWSGSNNWAYAMARSLLYILMKACLVFVMSGCCWTWLLYYDGMSNQMGISSFSSGFVRSFVRFTCLQNNCVCQISRALWSPVYFNLFDLLYCAGHVGSWAVAAFIAYSPWAVTVLHWLSTQHRLFERDRLIHIANFII